MKKRKIKKNPDEVDTSERKPEERSSYNNDIFERPAIPNELIIGSLGKGKGFDLKSSPEKKELITKENIGEHFIYAKIRKRKMQKKPSSQYKAKEIQLLLRHLTPKEKR